jgi:hypothetical protein
LRMMGLRQWLACVAVNAGLRLHVLSAPQGWLSR